MKFITSGALAAVLLGGIGWPLAAQAQGVPQGSYLQSCSNVGVRGDRLFATCLRVDGVQQRTSLADVNRCVGDIANNNGTLQCAYGGAAAPPPVADRCGRLHHEADELRERLQREGDPRDRARIEARLHELHEQEERCR